MMRLIAIAIGAVLTASANGAEPVRRPPDAQRPVAPRGDDPIGSARQEADGTLVLDLRAEGPDGMIGDAQFRYAPGDRDYDLVKRHLGPIPRGGSVLVKPFPD